MLHSETTCARVPYMKTLMEQVDRALQELHDLKFCNALGNGATLDEAKAAAETAIELPEDTEGA